MTVDVEALYLEQLSESDRRLLAHIAGPEAPPTRALCHPALEEAVFRAEVPEGSLAATSPFLTFATAVHRTAAHLETATFVEERWTARRRLPVFDVGSLRDLLAEPIRRLFLVQLLASYTRMASGVSWERTRRGWRRRRFSDLDPVSLAGLLEVVEPSERPGIYRRLGDLALFLTGVFPDHPVVATPSDITTARLLRMSGLGPDTAHEGPRASLLEQLGSRWYGLAASSARNYGAPLTSSLVAADEVGERFTDARRALNVVTDHYLFPLRDRWFGLR